MGEEARMQKWEYLRVREDWERPRWVNQQELPDWRKMPLMHTFISDLGEQGWELVSVVGHQKREEIYDYLFKRARP